MEIYLWNTSLIYFPNICLSILRRAEWSGMRLEEGEEKEEMMWMIYLLC